MTQPAGEETKRLVCDDLLIMSPIARMLDFLSKSIKEKEADLECPICMETAEIPIFMCQVSLSKDSLHYKDDNGAGDAPDLLPLPAQGAGVSRV